MDKTTQEVIENFYDNAFQKNDEWQHSLADTVSFSVGAKKKFEGKDMFLQVYTKFLQGVEKAVVKRLFVESDAACAIVSYDYISPKGAKLHQDDAEIWKVVDGQITSFTVYYDETEYRNFMEQ